ncbi:MAG: hypothetical protein V8Q17_00515 [Acutalibacteraceae bacterium]
MSTSKWTSVITNAGKNLLSYISEQHLVITKANVVTQEQKAVWKN